MLLGMSLLPLSASAQYKGAGVEACRSYAQKELEREGNKVEAVLIENDASLSIERYARRLGNQPVSSVLTGNGAVVYDGTPSAELSFLCLLADNRHALFFAWLPRPNAPSLAQCLRSEELRGKPRECLELLLRVAEQDLSTLYAYRFQEANERGDGSLAAYRKANDEWRQYRDAECVRRRELAPSGTAADDYQLSCVVDLTRRRALDMR